MHADELDSELEAGKAPRGPLHGLPLTLKENQCVEGLVTCLGDPQLTGVIASQDGDAAKLLKGAGGVVMGKTNLPMNATDWQSYNEVHVLLNSQPALS